jgi:molybdopterin-guanine dinucleotide biosynthesis protein
MKMKVQCCDLLVVIGFYDENIVDISTVHHSVRKSRDHGGNWDLNNKPQSSKTANATHNLNRHKVN